MVTIEYRLKFVVDGVKESQSFDFKCYIDINEIYNKLNESGNNYKLDELKYCPALLRQFDYIEISNGTISRITPNGYKFLISQLYGIECKY